MKTHEITTNKGEFVVVDVTDIGAIGWGKFPMRGKFKFICKLSEATEEYAKLIVDIQISGNVLEGVITELDTHRIEIYTYGCIGTKFISATMCLHSILKSKGIDINNGNWYLFKKV